MTLIVTLDSTPIDVSLVNEQIVVNLTPVEVDVTIAYVGPQGATGPAGPQGATGPAGPQGNPGPGVPTGGTTGQALVKIDGTNFNTEWSSISAGVSSFNWQPPSMSDSVAPNNSVYYSTTLGALAFKDSGGSSHALY